MTLGERIRAAREGRRMTQEELGALCGTTKQTIFKYETGTVTNIPPDRLERLAAQLEVSPAYLMGWETELPEKLGELAEPFGRLNEEGQDRVIGYCSDLAASGRYPRPEPKVFLLPRARRRRDGFIELKVYD